jgi:putative oxidoreductase
MRKFLYLSGAQRFGDFALLLLRVFVGAFLIWGVWDNITEPARMQEFVEFLRKFHFTSPDLLAPASVYAQLLIGLAFITGLLTRWAGILCIFNFAVAIIMVDRFGGMRAAFPSGCLIAIGLYLATHGAGRFSMDSALKANDAPRSNSGVRLKR